MMNAPKVLISGASGYLGQHLLETVASGDSYEIYAIYNCMTSFEDALKSKSPRCRVSSLDLTDASAIKMYLDEHGPFDVCLHLAALSSPGACQKDPDKARALNVPTHFFDALPLSTRIVALSTDQVYGGDKKSPYLEDVDDTVPLNAYAATKVELEKYLRSKREGLSNNLVLLRSSIMLGPTAPLCEDAHDTFLHFCASREMTPTTYFTDECRSVVAVSDVVRILTHFIEHPAAGVYNMGGPQRVSRHDMALAVARHLRWKDIDKVVVAAQKAEQPPSPIVSPLDITMDSSKLQALVGFNFLSLCDIVQSTFAN